MTLYTQVLDKISWKSWRRRYCRVVFVHKNIYNNYCNPHASPLNDNVQFKIQSNERLEKNAFFKNFNGSCKHIRRGKHKNTQ